MSKLFTLSTADWIKGGIVAGFMGGLTALYTGLTTPPVNWRIVAIAALGAALAYWAKNLLTDQSGKALGITATLPKGQ